MGIKYYYNVETKETSWLVPADLSRNPRYSNTTARAEGTPSLNRTISVDSIGSKSYSTILSGVATPQELFNIAHHVKGHPNWYYLYSAETPYYFNPSTRESSWSPPL